MCFFCIDMTTDQSHSNLYMCVLDCFIKKHIKSSNFEREKKNWWKKYLLITPGPDFVCVCKNHVFGRIFITYDFLLYLVLSIEDHVVFGALIDSEKREFGQITRNKNRNVFSHLCIRARKKSKIFSSIPHPISVGLKALRNFSRTHHDMTTLMSRGEGEKMIFSCWNENSTKNCACAKTRLNVYVF